MGNIDRSYVCMSIIDRSYVCMSIIDKSYVCMSNFVILVDRNSNIMLQATLLLPNA